MKLVSVNIEGDNHLDRVSAFLKNEQPDVVCLQEHFRVDSARFEQELGMNSCFTPISIIDQNLNARLTPKGEWGIAIFAKNVAEIDRYYYTNPTIAAPQFDGSLAGINYAVMSARCVVAGHEFNIATTHFTWSANGKTAPQQVKDMNALIQHLRKTKPDVICGDFNAPIGGQIRNMLAAVYKDNIPPDTKTTIDNNLHRDSSLVPGGIQLAVDGVFSAADVQVSNLRIVGGVSDHMALVGEIKKTAKR
jgi:endonuclease/exonuclease/phosphatase family metal-dependent hydrolase